MAQGLLLPRCYEKARHLAGLRNFLILWLVQLSNFPSKRAFLKAFTESRFISCPQSCPRTIVVCLIPAYGLGGYFAFDSARYAFVI